MREHKESPKLGPCHCGMLRLQRKTKEWREECFSPKYALDVLYMSCTQFLPHLFFSIILYHDTSMCTHLLLTISLSLGSYSPTCYSGLSNRPQPLSLTSAAGAPYLTSLHLPPFVLHMFPTLSATCLLLQPDPACSLDIHGLLLQGSPSNSAAQHRSCHQSGTLKPSTPWPSLGHNQNQTGQGSGKPALGDAARWPCGWTGWCPEVLSHLSLYLSM